MDSDLQCYCKVYLHHLDAQDPAIQWGSHVCYTTNTLDTIEAFIAEIYVQLVATESMCYSTSCECATVLCCGHSVNEHHSVLYGGLNNYLCRRYLSGPLIKRLLLIGFWMPQVKRVRTE